MKNIEIKASCSKPEKIHDLLIAAGAEFKGRDHQVDTYFNVNSGRLKSREGNIENALIHYFRPDTSDAKKSEFVLYHSKELQKLKEILERSLGIKVIVDKKRRIYFIDHVKFHIDEVKGLGNFLEIEVTDLDDKLSVEDMEATCNKFISYLGVKKEQLKAKSYSDMMLQIISAGS